MASVGFRVVFWWFSMLLAQGLFRVRGGIVSCSRWATPEIRELLLKARFSKDWRAGDMPGDVVFNGFANGSAKV